MHRFGPPSVRHALSRPASRADATAAGGASVTLAVTPGAPGASRLYRFRRRNLNEMMPSLLALALVAAALLWLVAVYNRLVRLRNQVRTAWADIDVQLLRRHDLVPQLVSAVGAYAGHERAVLETVTELRSRAMAQSSRPGLAQAEDELERAIGRLFVLKEAYPDLKASENFAQLQRDLVDVEDQLQYARRFYNGAVREHNDAIQRFPDLLVARPLGFAAEEFFDAGEPQRAAVKVEMP